jgi:hypothetical protein
MKINLKISSVLLTGMMALGVCSCSDSVSYAELLTEETKYANAYLADHIVYNEIPADTVFEYGENAPFYRLDEEGNMYMQVVKPGTKGNMAVSGQTIYFRFTRWNLKYYSDGEFTEDGYGNSDDMLNLGTSSTSFRFENYTIPSSYMWGSGLQYPLYYLPIDCEVNILIKSQYGLTDETSDVIPYLYNVRYFKAQI